MALARSRRLGIADLLGSEAEGEKSKRKKGEHFPSPGRLGAMTDSHLKTFFPCRAALSAGESFPPPVYGINQSVGNATHRSISKLFDIDLAMLSGRH
ncbi:hypothetical protein [Pseudomonas sp. NPDC089534]|uniref:hypothetical protein n=1 Tax=Pseudomonas sp. NPDC089534 TaxID=3364468 RepID=UPI003822671E